MEITTVHQNHHRPRQRQRPWVGPPTPEAPNSLPEFSLYRPRPGHPDWPRLAAEARDLAARMGPTLEQPRTGLAKWRQRMASQATVLENYVTNRRRTRAGREGRLIGAALFTSGLFGGWKHFQYQQPILDDIADYIAANPTPVPEPASWLMLVAGFGLLSVLYRRRRHLAQPA